VLEALTEAKLLTPTELVRADIFELRDVLREKGLAVSDATLARVKYFARWLVAQHRGQLDWLFDPHRSITAVREEIASIHGIGLTTADALLLHALKVPSFPVDRATLRVLYRHAWLDTATSYDEARDRLVDLALEAEDPVRGGPVAATILSDLAHGMEQIARRYCVTAAPRCDTCPFEGLLPEGGPREPDE
jgi:endonuclease III